MTYNHKHPTFNEALSTLSQQGTLDYHGRAGSNYEYCVYTLTIGSRRVHLNIYDDGTVKEYKLKP